MDAAGRVACNSGLVSMLLFPQELAQGPWPAGFVPALSPTSPLFLNCRVPQSLLDLPFLQKSQIKQAAEARRICVESRFPSREFSAEGESQLISVPFEDRNAGLTHPRRREGGLGSKAGARLQFIPKTTKEAALSWGIRCVLLRLWFPVGTPWLL